MGSGEDVVRNAQTTGAGFVLVSLYSWMTITWGILIARFVRGLFLHRILFGADDVMALAGNIVYLGSVVAWQYTVYGGLGKPFTDVSPSDAALFSKAFLAAQLLEIFAMTFAKSSSALLMERVAPGSRKARLSLLAMTLVYCMTCVLAITFRCGVPSDWAHRAPHCGNYGFLIVAIGFNITSDLILAGWLFPTLMSLSVDTEKRWTAMVLFGSRALVAAIAGIQIWAATKVVSGDDPTEDIVDYAVLSQAVTSLSLIVANIPRVKRIIGVGGGSILYPEIQQSELTATRSRQFSADNGLKLVPSGSARFTTTVTSKGSKDRKKGKMPADWQGLVTLGGKEDEHTSTSSLFDRNERDGVMLEREVHVVVENRNAEAKVGLADKDDRESACTSHSIQAGPERQQDKDS